MTSRTSLSDASARSEIATDHLPLPSSNEVTALADLFRILSDPTRIRIISALLQRQLCTSELAELTGLSESAISHQMRDLRLQRLVSAERRGRNVYFSLLDHHVRHVLEDTLKHVRE